MPSNYEAKNGPTFGGLTLVRMGVEADARLLVEDSGASLNNYLTHYMETEGAQRLINFCRGQIDTHNTNVGDLRALFSQVVRKLRKLHQVSADTPMNFAEGLGRFMNVDDVRRTIDRISFQKNLHDDVVHQTSDWAHALQGTIEKIERLSASPEINYNPKDKILSIKGTLIGISDVATALKENQRSLSRIDVQGWNTLFIDGNLTSRGTSLSMIAPHWKVIGQRIIDLSGMDGADGISGLPRTNTAGGDGQPGEPGKNGGHFYGKVKFVDALELSQLMINTNGGYGGHGAAGVDGENGKDGDLNQVTRTEPYHSRYRAGGYWSNDDGSRNFYQAQGTEGTSGQNGGRGGQGGFGGTTRIDGPQDFNLIANTGTVGVNGIPGVGGRGGTHGQHCNGQVIVNIHHRHWHDNGKVPPANYAIADRIEIARAHTGPRGSAPNGSPGEGLNVGGQQRPATQIPLNPVPIVQDFASTYQNALADPLTSPFVKIYFSWFRRGCI
jgi:hypothetical protein